MSTRRCACGIGRFSVSDLNSSAPAPPQGAEHTHPTSRQPTKSTPDPFLGHSLRENALPSACTLADSVPRAAWTSATNSVHSRQSGCLHMSSCSLSIDDYLAHASPVLGRMRLDGLTETAVPFPEGIVVLWRRGAASSEMTVEALTDALKVWSVPSSVLRHCARGSECTSPPPQWNPTTWWGERAHGYVPVSASSQLTGANAWPCLESCCAGLRGGACMRPFADIEGRVGRSVFTLFTCGFLSVIAAACPLINPALWQLSVDRARD